MNKPTPEQQKQKALNALMEKPSTYFIEVIDNSMLPTSLIDDKEIKFTIAPPSPGVMAMCAVYLNEIPKELLQPEAKVTLQDMLPYTETLLKIICVIAHGKESDYPEWWLKFLLFNTEPKDVYKIFHETALKMQSDFFLTSFQIASQINPMTMRMMKRKEDSTPGN